MQPYPFKKQFGSFVALVAWFAVLMQLVLIIQNRTATLPETLIRFFSFFTILTNILVALYLTIVSLRKEAQGFWFRPATATAVAVYILVVGIVYNVVLRQLWAPVGMQRVVDELLHLVVPLLYFLYWVFYIVPTMLPWKTALSWLWYPFVYLVFVLTRGSFSNYYPYPFLDVFNHGYEKVMIASGAMLLLFLVLSIAFIAASRYRANKNAIA